MNKVLLTYNLKFTLLDDMHTGSGLGTELINSLQARDSQNNPVIWRQHVKGLLQQAANQLNQYAPNHKHSAHIKALLNETINNNCLLIPGSCYIDSNDSDNTILLTSTAREASKDINSENVNLNRAPKAGSLRTQEYIKAGTQFLSTWYLCVTEQHQSEYQAAFEALLKRITHLGANRNRGAGQIKLEQKYTQTPLHQAISNTDLNSIKVTLTNSEPLRLPNTDIPGNVIPTNTFISGNQLTAALANWCLLQGEQPLFEALTNGDFCVTYAYPTTQTSQTPTFPAPLNLQTVKQSCKETNTPWWAQSDNTQNFIDGFQKDVTEKTKRLKGQYYITDKPNERTLVEQAIAIQMRNKVRTDFENDDNSALFSEEVIPENTHFKLTITNDNKQHLNALYSLLSQSPLPLLLGRGKAPCHINAIAEKIAPHSTQPLTDDLTLVLASPLLCYNPTTVEPYNSLDHQVINTLFSELNLEQQDYQSFSEQTQLTGYSFETGLPKQPVACIAAGSCIQITNREKASKLAAILSDYTALGEKQTIGLGQYWLYQGQLKVTTVAPSLPKFEQNQKETVLAKLAELITNTSGYPSVTQWQRLKRQFKEVKLNNTQSVETVFNHPLQRQRLLNVGWDKVKPKIKDLIALSNNDPDLAILCCDFIIAELRINSKGDEK